MLHRQDIAQDEFDGKSLAYVLGAGTPGTNKLHIGFTHCFCKKYFLTLKGFKQCVTTWPAQTIEAYSACWEVDERLRFKSKGCVKKQKKCCAKKENKVS